MIYSIYVKELISDKNKVVSSAIGLIFISLPFILLSLLILMAVISATKINSRAEIGQPCLIDLVRIKHFE